MVFRGLSSCLYYNIDSLKCLCRNHRSTNNSNHSWAVKSLTMVLYFWDSRGYNIARRGQDPSKFKKEETKMAKKAKGGKPTKTKGAKTITVKDLQAEYPQLAAHQIRQVIRSLG